MWSFQQNCPAFGEGRKTAESISRFNENSTLYAEELSYYATDLSVEPIVHI